MANSYALKAEARDRAGKGVSRALRRENKVPAVIYGDNKEAVAISLPENELFTEWNKGVMFTTLCDLELDGKKHQLLARDVQLHPVSDKILHVDFLRVSDKTSITVSVPVNFIDEEECEGLQEGGILNAVRFELDLVVKATLMPDAIDVSLKGYTVGDAIKMSDVTLPEGATSAITDRDFTIATIAAPRALVEEEPTEEEVEGEEGEVAEGEEGEVAEGGDAEESSEE